MSKSVRKIGAVGASTTLLGGAGSALLLALAASPAGAVPTTWTVDTLADGAATAADCTTPVVGSCSLRDALAAAAAGDTIQFSSALFTGGAGTITLTNGALADNGVALSGPGANLLTVNGNSASRVFQLGAAAATLSGMTVTGGTYGGAGGGIQSSGNLTLDRMVVTGNSANAGAGVFAAGEVVLTDSIVSANTALLAGGGVFASGATTITRSTVSGNTAGGAGGGMYLNDAATVTDSTISGNSVTGGAAGGASIVGALTISGSTISGNTSSESAGGAYVGGALTMTDSTVSGNTAGFGGAGLHAHGATSIVGATFVDNNAGACGGALYLGVSDSSLSILNSTFSENEATNCSGGAVYIFGSGVAVAIDNSTFTANTAVSGGALNIPTDNSVRIAMSTITGNISTNTNQPAFYTGGGIHLQAGRPTTTSLEVSGATGTTSSLEMSGVILAGNIAAAGGTADLAVGARDFPGTGTVLATNSMIGTVTSNVTLNGTNLVRGSDPMLGALANNGGPTPTMLPLAGSPVIDAGPAIIPDFPGNAFDQRGPGFPRLSGASSDIGAVEVQVVTPVFTG